MKFARNNSALMLPLSFGIMGGGFATNAADMYLTAGNALAYVEPYLKQDVAISALWLLGAAATTLMGKKAVAAAAAGAVIGAAVSVGGLAVVDTDAAQRLGHIFNLSENEAPKPLQFSKSPNGTTLAHLAPKAAGRRFG